MAERKFLWTLTWLLLLNSCNAQQAPKPSVASATGTLQSTRIVCGAERFDLLLPLLSNKSVGLLVNHTSLVGLTHLVDTLVALKIDIKKIFAPEHGFRGSADAGEHVRDSIDARSGVKITSLYGNKHKPSDSDLHDVDVMIFDIQDVGTRFYTYISSLHYLMEACAENKKELIVLDRPNPNGWYVDGPVLKNEFRSFVGLDPVPVVHGLTVGEYAQMANGEKWLEKGVQCSLKVIACLNYDHKMRYSLPVKPSPGLPNAVAVYNYPSICFFEGTDVSLGRGTDYPFQMIGSPDIRVKKFSFIPVSKPGAKSPPHMNQVCYGYDLRRVNTYKSGIDLSYLLKVYAQFSDSTKFFLPNNFFDKLAGTDELRKQVIARMNETAIKASWKKGLEEYKLRREKYLLYSDF